MAGNNYIFQAADNDGSAGRARPLTVVDAGVARKHYLSTDSVIVAGFQSRLGITDALRGK